MRVCACVCLCTVQCLLPMKTHSGLVAHVITPPKLFVRPVALHAAQCVVGNLSALCRVGVVDIVVACLRGLSLSRVVNGCFVELLLLYCLFFQMWYCVWWVSPTAGMVVLFCLISVACCRSSCPKLPTAPQKRVSPQKWVCFMLKRRDNPKMYLICKCKDVCQ